MTEYRDFADRVILKKVENDGGDLSTYYVYDDFGLLRYVLPPETYATIIAVPSTQVYALNAEWILNYCFYYQYDGRKRMITKRLPGVEPVYLVYNNRDQLVATQDGNMRSLRKWLFTKYDVFNRPVMTGLYQHSSVFNQTQMQAFVNIDDDYFESAGNYHGYTNQAFPDITTPGCEVYTVTYYDDYTYVELPGFNGRYGFRPGEIVFMYPRATNLKGQITATKTKILPNSEITPPFSNSYLISAIYYDEYLRVIQTVSDNHKGGLDIVSHRVNFTGDVLLTKETHTNTGAPLIVQHEFSYDNGKRLTTTKHQITGQSPVTLSDNKYEELGRLKRKYLHEGSSSALQTVNYRYNIRGWLTDINDVAGLGNDKFAMKLNYKDAAHAQYNGNIASMKWNTAMFNTQEYQFEYDKANRLKSAATSQGTGNYSTSYIYDKNGNLINLNRFGKIEGENNYDYIDKLIYYYTGNKLKCVNDWYDDDYQNNGFSDNGSFSTTTPEFIYDANGNMLSDQNKDLDTIEYNFLNLPQQINFSEGYQEINYLYTANGQKLMKQTRTDNEVDQTVDYIGNFVYEDGTLKYLLTDEGRVVVNSGPSYEYQYFLKDHLGNTRITFNQNGQIIQEDAYYPFGMSMNGLCYQSGTDYENKYLYNGKELQDEFGLDWYDYGARMYDAVIGRWQSVDPLAEKYNELSPYNYVGNNPIKRIDTNGKDWDVVINHDQQTITIKANFSTFAGNESTLQGAAKNWNSQSGKFAYNIGEGDATVSYSVNFDISVNDISSEASALNGVSVAPDDSKAFSSRVRTDADGNKITTEGLSDGKNILIKESQKDNSQITAHEMGHNLGMTDTKGLMNGQGSGKDLKSKSVQETLGRSGIGTPVKGSLNGASLQKKSEIGKEPVDFQKGKLKTNKEWEKSRFLK